MTPPYKSLKPNLSADSTFSKRNKIDTARRLNYDSSTDDDDDDDDDGDGDDEGNGNGGGDDDE